MHMYQSNQLQEPMRILRQYKGISLTREVISVQELQMIFR